MERHETDPPGRACLGRAPGVRGTDVPRALSFSRDRLGFEVTFPGPASRPALNLVGTITCPHCEHRTAEAIPADACLFFFDCPGCGVRLRPRPGDCCVFCSYSDQRCPSRQSQQTTLPIAPSQ
ncbi:MAG: GDCCVxC domain-containing (seleno)protein [Bryobacteraceae bacterium]